MKKVKTAVSVVLLLMTFTTVLVSAAEYGSAEDPLVTLSYLNKVVVPDLVAKVTEQLKGTTVASPTATAPAASNQYIPLMLTKGQTIYGKDAGIEVLLRSGSLTVVDPIGDKIVNMTNGTEASAGEALLLQNLYMIPRADQRGITALSDEAWILVRGTYSIK